MAQVATASAEEVDISLLLRSTYFYRGVGFEAMKYLVDSIWVTHPTLPAVFAKTTVENSAGYRMLRQLGFRVDNTPIGATYIPLRGCNVETVRHVLVNPYKNAIF